MHVYSLLCSQTRFVPGEAGSTVGSLALQHQSKVELYKPFHQHRTLNKLFKRYKPALRLGDEATSHVCALSSILIRDEVLKLKFDDCCKSGRKHIHF